MEYLLLEIKTTIQVTLVIDIEKKLLHFSSFFGILLVDRHPIKLAETVNAIKLTCQLLHYDSYAQIAE